MKILPDHGENDPRLYGHITGAAVSAAEIRAPQRNRAYSLSVTASGQDWRGRPSSWSSAIDDLCYGAGEDQRLIIVSAGNIDAAYPAVEYLDQNDAASIQTPAQSWNALSVGAVTEKCTVTDPTYAGWIPVSPAGDLSPLSRTSVTWQDQWPLKPDIVFEGGNLAVDPTSGHGDQIDDLCLLSTHHRLYERMLTVSCDTSAATALVARMAAQLYADRPELWPETVRALIIHSADWTPAMRGRLPLAPQGQDKRLLLRRYGYGVPDLQRALRSVTSDVTLVVEGQLQPFRLENSTIKTCDMVLHELPWPTGALEELGEEVVEMKVTLSYFIEPNPGERGWTKRHRYASHGLRFAVKRAEETVNDFMRRINRAARDENEPVPGGMGNDEGWMIGPTLRNRGSIHSDTWKGTAADLAARHGVAVFPVGGWWREKKYLERYDQEVRYALLITLKTQADIDLYAEI